MIKEFLYKTIFLYYNFALKRKKHSDVNGMVVALLSCVTLMYFMPFIMLIYSFFDTNRNKTLFNIIMWCYFIFNYYIINKIYKYNINKILEYFEKEKIYKYEKYLIISLSLLSVPFFVAILLFFRVINLV